MQLLLGLINPHGPYSNPALGLETLEALPTSQLVEGESTLWREPQPPV